MRPQLNLMVAVVLLLAAPAGVRTEGVIEEDAAVRRVLDDDHLRDAGR
ncbi:MAG: hypothetical protein ACRD15_12375 [Vicinamibacterales bacterium]